MAGEPDKNETSKLLRKEYSIAEHGFMQIIGG